MDECCELCGRCGTDFMPLHTHHVFGGTGNRRLSDEYSMKARLCYECHQGDKGVHKNAALALTLKQRYQRKFEKRHGHALFMAVFRKNYL